MHDLIAVEGIAQWERLKTLVLDSVSSPITKRVYNMALNEFMAWFQQAPRPGFTKATVSAWRVSLEERHGFLEVISGSNSHWLRGYGNPPPETVVAAGFLRVDLETVFSSCELAGHFTIPYGIENNAIGDHTDIFVCRRPREPWDVFWRRFHSFG